MTESGKMQENDAATCQQIGTELTRLRSHTVPGRVYFMSAGDFIKIGYSLYPLRRMDDFKGASPLEVNLLAEFAGTKADEAALLAQFSHLRVRGEWFHRHSDILDYIASRTRKVRFCEPETKQEAVSDETPDEPTKILRTLAARYGTADDYNKPAVEFYLRRSFAHHVASEPPR